MRCFLSTVLALAVGLAAEAFTPTEPGLYAVFSTTKGEFAAKLHFDKVPLTVANFVGLAEGTIVSFDASGNPQKKRFYDGITFHRVIKDFMNQAGSPNGLGTDGPGYRFPDEIDNTLFHEKAGTLSMANSGSNTNGSQLFVTAVPTPWLDGKHAVFGEVVEGLPVVAEINNVPTVGNSPVTPVVINSVTIVRQGDAAKAFDPSKWGVPGLASVPSALLNKDGKRQLLINREPTAEYFIYASNDLLAWSGPTKLAADPAAPQIAAIDITDSLAASGARFVQIGKKAPIASRELSGVRVTLKLTGLADIVIDLAAGFQGAYSHDGANGALAYQWYDVGRRTQLFANYSGLRDMQIYFDRGATSGPVFVRVVETSSTANDGFNLTGTFSIGLVP